MFEASSLMAQHGIQAVFSCRLGGVSTQPFDSLNLGLGLGDDANVQQNLHTLCQATHMPIPHQAKQVHGVDVLWCDGAGRQHPAAADILITQDTSTSLAVRTADCLPLLLADTQASIITAVHAGWRGTVMGVAKKAVQAMCDMGASEQHILASLGPCIQACCFEVSEDVGQQLSVSCGKKVHQVKHNVYYTSLSKANQYQLLACGLNAKNIEIFQACTVCSVSPPYFSYRRDHGQTGRQLAMIRLA